jgi:TetR/AcrR family transcriptional regulator
VFAQFGFQKASTALIAQEAQLSKGLIFHYFTNKSELYLAAYQSAVAIITHDIFDHVDFSEKDLINRFKKVILAKLEVAKRHPEIFDFIQQSYFDEASPLREQLDDLNVELMTVSFARIYENIDTTKFRPGLDVQLAITTITYTLEKWSENYVREHLSGLPGGTTSPGRWTKKQYEEATRKIEPLLQFFRTTFYQEAP